MTMQKYIFQQKQRSLAEKIFIHGLNATGYVLLSLAEAGEMFLKNLPDCYPGFKLMKELGGVGKHKNRKFKKEIIDTEISRLKKQGLVAKDPIKKVYYLTPEGKRFTAYIKDRYSILKNPWDKKLRIVIFDIPETKKYCRQWLRKELSLLQFQQLQKSVYVGKYSLPESFYQELAEADIDNYVFILTVGEIDKQREILKLFD